MYSDWKQRHRHTWLILFVWTHLSRVRTLGTRTTESLGYWSRVLGRLDLVHSGSLSALSLCLCWTLNPWLRFYGRLTAFHLGIVPANTITSCGQEADSIEYIRRRGIRRCLLLRIVKCWVLESMVFKSGNDSKSLTNCHLHVNCLWSPCYSMRSWEGIHIRSLLILTNTALSTLSCILCVNVSFMTFAYRST